MVDDPVTAGPHLGSSTARLLVSLQRLLSSISYVVPRSTGRRRPPARRTPAAEHSVFGITVFPPGSKHDIHRHPNAEEFEYLVSGKGIARVGDADVELGPGEVVFVPKNDYHGFENTGDEPVFMIWGYGGAASLDEAGYIRYVDDHRA